jgi:hypothetical protein
VCALRLFELVRKAFFVFSFFALSGGFVRAATVPLDPNFGERGVMRLLSSKGSPLRWVLTSLSNDQIVATVQYRDIDQFGVLFEEIRFFRASSGAPTSTYGNQGLVSGGLPPNCSPPPTVAEAIDGAIYRGVGGKNGFSCSVGGFASVERLSQSGFRSGSEYSASTETPYSRVGLAPMPDGRMLFGYIDKVSTSDSSGTSFYKVSFVAIGDKKGEITHEWTTEIGSPRDVTDEGKLIIRMSPKGGFVAALNIMGQLKLFRLDAAGKPSDEWGVNMPAAGLRPSFQRNPRDLLDLVVTDNGDFALAVVDREPTIDVYRFFETAKGSIAYGMESTQIPLGSNVKGGFTRVAEFIGASSGGEGQLQNEVTFYSKTLEHGTKKWVWTPPASASTGAVVTPKIHSLAVLPRERSAIATIFIGENGTNLAKFDFSKAVQPVRVREFFNSTLNHYFVTGSIGELNSIIRGDAGPGWSGTSLEFDAYENAQTAPANAVPVCRFYGTPGKGPNSHFYTFEGPECEAVKKDPGWLYEGIAFYAIKPAASGCGAGELAVYRAYNNRFAQNGSNHRYSVNLATLKAMVGWTVEGVVFCSPLR